MNTPPSLPPKGPADTQLADTPTAKRTQPPTPQERTRIPLPHSFNVLPTRELTKLLDTLDVLKGYLITLMRDQIKKDCDELDAVVKQVEGYIQQLRDLESQKKDTNFRLAQLQALVQQWQVKEAEMHQSLQKFSRESIYSLLQASISESRRLTDSMQVSFLSHTGKHDEASIIEFVRNYRQERTKFYLRKEKINRFNENRIGGLS